MLHQLVGVSQLARLVVGPLVAADLHGGAGRSAAGHEAVAGQVVPLLVARVAKFEAGVARERERKVLSEEFLTLMKGKGHIPARGWCMEREVELEAGFHR